MTFGSIVAMMILPGRPSWRQILPALAGVGVAILGGVSLATMRCDRSDARSRVRTRLTARYGATEAERRMRVYEDGLKGKSEGGRDLFWQATEGQLTIPQATLDRMAYLGSPEYRRKKAIEDREAYIANVGKRRTNDPIFPRPTTALFRLSLEEARKILVRDSAREFDLSFQTRLASGANVRLGYATSVLPRPEGEPGAPSLPVTPLRTIARDSPRSLPIYVSLELTYAERSPLAAMRRLGLDVSGAKRLSSPDSPYERWSLPKSARNYRTVTVMGNTGFISGLSFTSEAGSSIYETGPSGAPTSVGR